MISKLNEWIRWKRKEQKRRYMDQNPFVESFMAMTLEWRGTTERTKQGELIRNGTVGVYNGGIWGPALTELLTLAISADTFCKLCRSSDKFSYIFCDQGRRKKSGTVKKLCLNTGAFYYPFFIFRRKRRARGIPPLQHSRLGQCPQLMQNRHLGKYLTTDSRLKQLKVGNLSKLLLDIGLIATLQLII